MNLEKPERDSSHEERMRELGRKAGNGKNTDTRSLAERQKALMEKYKKVAKKIK